MKNEIIFLAGIPSPFMTDLFGRINESGKFTCHIFFLDDDLEDRGIHWRDLSNRTSCVHLYKSCLKTDKKTWVRSILAEIHPSLVLVGSGPWGERFEIGWKIARTFNAPLGLWLEQPYPRADIRYFTKKYIFKRLCKNKVDFIFGIGDRAVEVYSKLLGRPYDVINVPYYQKLPKYSDSDNIAQDKIGFLFSGRLVRRNNIKGLIRAVIMLHNEERARFQLCISAEGAEQRIIDKAVRQTSGLNDVITYDKRFEKWDDRLRPFKNSQVLLVPAFHSGWGLVIPEALSCGLAVISTRQVESARYYIEHMVNGLLINATVCEIFHAMRFCVRNPFAVRRMQYYAMKSAWKGDVKQGASIMSDVFRERIEIGKKSLTTA